MVHHVVTTIVVEVMEAVTAMIVVTTTVLAMMIVIVTLIVATIMALAVLIDMLLQVVMTGIAAAQTVVTVVIVDMIVVMTMEEMGVVPTPGMATLRLLGTHTEVESMTTETLTIGIPVDDYGRLIYPGAERSAK